LSQAHQATSKPLSLSYSLCESIAVWMVNFGWWLSYMYAHVNVNQSQHVTRVIEHLITGCTV